MMHCRPLLGWVSHAGSLSVFVPFLQFLLTSTLEQHLHLAVRISSSQSLRRFPSSLRLSILTRNSAIWIQAIRDAFLRVASKHQALHHAYFAYQRPYHLNHSVIFSPFHPGQRVTHTLIQFGVCPDFGSAPSLRSNPT
jgi:hypothetical protein